MAKGVTEDDLASGLKSVGGFGALTRSRADSPFRDSRVETKTVDISLPIEETPEAKEPPTVKEERQESKPLPVEDGVRVKPSAAKPKPKASQRKADIYTERVTIQMSPKMRDEVDELARQLQRAKTSTDERITANTVVRVAIRSFLDSFDVDFENAPNSEGELLEHIRKGRQK